MGASGSAVSGRHGELHIDRPLTDAPILRPAGTAPDQHLVVPRCFGLRTGFAWLERRNGVLRFGLLAEVSSRRQQRQRRGFAGAG